MEIARGLEGIAVAETRLSSVDGGRGELLIGGFPVGELAPRASFEEVLFLMWHGRLPERREHLELRRALGAERRLPDETTPLLRAAAARRVAVMDALEMALPTLRLAGDLDRGPAGEDIEQAARLVGRFPTIVGAYWRLLRGLEPVAPRADLGHAANYLYMIDGRGADQRSGARRWRPTSTRWSITA